MAELPSRYGPYQIVSPLGAGGMGQVYRARDTRLQRFVAIKVLHDGTALDADRQRRFAQEAVAASALNHPNILTVYDVGADGEIHYLVVSASAMFAQAWVPARGEGAVSLSTQELNVKQHLAGTTMRDSGHINTVVVLTDVTYGLTDKVAVDLAVPVVSSAYSGAKPHPGTDIDNGNFHSSVTDLRFSVRYNVSRKGAVITPYVGSIVPSHAYPYYGHAAAGERLRELQVGAFVAKLFTSGVPGLFVSSRLAYGFVEKVQDISHNKSMGDLEVGYFVTPRFRAFAMTNGAYTHGGIDFPLGGLAAVPLRYQPVHDIVQRVNYLHAGGGFAYSISDSVDVFGSFSRLVAGRNGHALNRGITLGASWNFSRRSARSAAAAGTGAPASEYARTVARREGSLARCVCQKSGT